MGQHAEWEVEQEMFGRLEYCQWEHSQQESPMEWYHSLFKSPNAKKAIKCFLKEREFQYRIPKPENATQKELTNWGRRKLVTTVNFLHSRKKWVESYIHKFKIDENN